MLTALLLAANVRGFSALQRAEIAEISDCGDRVLRAAGVSVLFNEPKLLKSREKRRSRGQR